MLLKDTLYKDLQGVILQSYPKHKFNRFRAATDTGGSCTTGGPKTKFE